MLTNDELLAEAAVAAEQFWFKGVAPRLVMQFMAEIEELLVTYELI